LLAAARLKGPSALERGVPSRLRAGPLATHLLRSLGAPLPRQGGISAGTFVFVLAAMSASREAILSSTGARLPLRRCRSVPTTFSRECWKTALHSCSHLFRVMPSTVSNLLVARSQRSTPCRKLLMEEAGLGVSVPGRQ